jgi:hypothetical protein
VAASVTLDSQYDFRGLSLSDRRPTLNLNLSWDDASGAYLGASAIGETTKDQGPQMLGEFEYIGYARRPSVGPGWDIGVSNLRYAAYAGGSPTSGGYGEGGQYGASIASGGTVRTDMTQVYAGLLGKVFSFYNFYSPDYLGEGVGALYSDLSAAAHPASRWRVFAHVGVLTPVDGRTGEGRRAEQYDLRAGVAAELRRAEIQLAWTTRRPSDNALGPYRQNTDGLLISASWFF